MGAEGRDEVVLGRASRGHWASWSPALTVATSCYPSAIHLPDGFTARVPEMEGLAAPQHGERVSQGQSKSCILLTSLLVCAVQAASRGRFCGLGLPSGLSLFGL